MARDRSNLVSTKQPPPISRRVARLASDETLTKLEARVAAGREPQWKLDLVRSARACIKTNTCHRAGRFGRNLSQTQP
jgi:hypothetical protein